jgi:glycosyltransferase involved in cell wall biosynthesis
VDDRCPEGSGEHVERNASDDRIRIIRHAENKGVGGAVISGYQAAIEDGIDVIVKIDGDGQMAPELIPQFVAPILDGYADYTKGNRFYDLSEIGQMPPLRILGNAALSFMAKFSTGYWDLFDPTNGYTAIHSTVAAHLPFEKISKRYFFETDVLFRLGTMRASVLDIPMDASYGNEESNLRIAKVFPEFLVKHTKNAFKRIFYSYFLRDLSVASLELVFGTGLLCFAVLFGGHHWSHALATGQPTPVGTIVLAALSALVGVQLFLAFLSYDMRPRTSRALHTFMPFGVRAVVPPATKFGANDPSRGKPG